jgi:hypothetical protein
MARAAPPLLPAGPMKASPALHVSVTVTVLLVLASTASCLSGGEEKTGTSSAAQQVCVFDAACVDFPDASAPGWPEAGLPAFDAGVPTFPWPDAQAPTWPDAGAFAAFCDAFEPKYYAEYVQAVSMLQVTPCYACAPTDCCYQGLACVAQ